MSHVQNKALTVWHTHIVWLFCLEFTNEQREIQQLAQKFTQDEIIPKAAYHDQTGEVTDLCIIMVIIPVYQEIHCGLTSISI